MMMMMIFGDCLWTPKLLIETTKNNDKDDGRASPSLSRSHLSGSHPQKQATNKGLIVRVTMVEKVMMMMKFWCCFQFELQKVTRAAGGSKVKVFASPRTLMAPIASACHGDGDRFDGGHSGDLGDKHHHLSGLSGWRKKWEAQRRFSLRDDIE